MCNLSDGVEQRGIRKGIQQCRREDINNLMKNLKMTCEQAMDALGIPEEEREEYKIEH